ncbi:MAG TPA: hypothetical protein V6C72_09985 [Chroococcales cyanobacterium]
MFKDQLTNLLLCAAVAVSIPQSAEAASEAKEVNMSVVVHAKPRAVWEAIRGQRVADKAHRKLISYHDDEALIEEHFPALPIIGAATCLYKEHEVPLKRIDYSMVESNQFRQFEGSWVISPTEDGNATVVNLSSRLDPGLRVPFWKEITKVATTKHVKERLSAVRHDAEILESKVQTAGLLAQGQ